MVHSFTLFISWSLLTYRRIAAVNAFNAFNALSSQTSIISEYRECEKSDRNKLFGHWVEAVLRLSEVELRHHSVGDVRHDWALGCGSLPLNIRRVIKFQYS